jgi:MFS transporter, SP family, general alpha glucoside:H+ symporter
MAEKTHNPAEETQTVDPALRNVNTTNEEVVGWVALTVEARNATEQEHNLTWLKAVKLYPKACFWSAVVSLVVIMDGYDTALIGSLFGFPAFQKRFGVEQGTTGKYQVSAKWQDALGLASPLGNVVGIFINGVLTERFGHKKTLLLSIIWLTGVSSSRFSPLMCRSSLSASSSVACLGVCSRQWHRHTLPRSLLSCSEDI